MAHCHLITHVVVERQQVGVLVPVELGQDLGLHLQGQRLDLVRNLKSTGLAKNFQVFPAV